MTSGISLGLSIFVIFHPFHIPRCRGKDVRELAENLLNGYPNSLHMLAKWPLWTSSDPLYILQNKALPFLAPAPLPSLDNLCFSLDSGVDNKGCALSFSDN